MAIDLIPELIASELHHALWSRDLEGHRTSPETVGQAIAMGHLAEDPSVVGALGELQRAYAVVYRRSVTAFSSALDDAPEAQNSMDGTLGLAYIAAVAGVDGAEAIAPIHAARALSNAPDDLRDPLTLAIPMLHLPPS